MAINTTTASVAILTTDTTVTLASVTGVTGPNYQTGAGITYLLVEQEVMKVSGAPAGLVVPVIRGELGTVVAAHAASVPVVAGLPTDFSSFAPAMKAFVPSLPTNWLGFSAPVNLGAGNALVATGPYFHISAATAVIKTITAPAGYQEGGEITVINDGSGTGLTWDATGNIAVAGTFTTAGSAVTFVFDNGSGKWHPSRLS